MNHSLRFATSLILTTIVMLALLASGSAPPKRMALFLLVGQSNMAGRGPLDSLAGVPNKNIWALDAQNNWIPAKDPLHSDKPAAVGVGPGLSFAKKWLEYNPDQPIGLIPAAIGGSTLDDWRPGQKHEQTGIYAYDAMLARVKLARKSGKLTAILWHQGESDSNEASAKVYEAKLTDFFIRLRRDLDAPDLPILLGTLGDFYVEKNPEAARINSIIQNYPLSHSNTYLVLAAGLTDKGDQTHFDTASARELGRRYANELWKISKK